MTNLQKVMSGHRSQKVIVEYKEDGREWWVMFSSGDVQAFDHASAAMKAIKRRSMRGNKTITITTIEWRNTPQGFKPPQE